MKVGIGDRINVESGECVIVAISSKLIIVKDIEGEEVAYEYEECWVPPEFSGKPEGIKVEAQVDVYDENIDKVVIPARHGEVRNDLTVKLVRFYCEECGREIKSLEGTACSKDESTGSLLAEFSGVCDYRVVCKCGQQVLLKRKYPFIVIEDTDDHLHQFELDEKFLHEREPNV